MKKLYIIVLAATLSLGQTISARSARDWLDDLNPFMLLWNFAQREDLLEQLTDKKCVPMAEVKPDVEFLITKRYVFLPIYSDSFGEGSPVAGPNEWPCKISKDGKRFGWDTTQFSGNITCISDDECCKPGNAWPCVMKSPKGKCVLRMNKHTGLFTTNYHD